MYDTSFIQTITWFIFWYTLTSLWINLNVSIDIWILKSLRHHSAVYTLKYTRYTSNIRKNERYTEIYLGNTSISVVVKAELYKFINIMILLSFFLFFYYRYPSFRFLLHIVTHRYPYRRYHFSYFAAFRHFTPQ